MKYTHFNHRPYEIHTLVYDLVAPGSKVLDLGCAMSNIAHISIRLRLFSVNTK